VTGHFQQSGYIDLQVSRDVSRFIGIQSNEVRDLPPLTPLPPPLDSNRHKGVP
jgi:hypothetical protein